MLTEASRTETRMEQRSNLGSAKGDDAEQKKGQRSGTLLFDDWSSRGYEMSCSTAPSTCWATRSGSMNQGW